MSKTEEKNRATAILEAVKRLSTISPDEPFTVDKFFKRLNEFREEEYQKLRKPN